MTLTNQFLEQGTGSKRIWVRTDNTYENKIFEKRFVSSANTYDIYGNVTQNVTNNNNEETTTTTSTFGAFGTPIPAKPTSVTGSNTRCCGPATYSATTTYGYNSIGQLTSKTDFSGLPQNIVTTYSYNSLGNRTGETVTPAGMPVRSGTSTFDTKGRFALTTTNALGQTATATFDAKWGKLLSETGIDGLTTSYNYDAFGRLLTTITPQGWIITESYGWDVNSSAGTIHYHRTSHPGKPDVKIWYDLLDREKITQVEGFQNQWITTQKSYDARGNVVTSTDPYKSGEPIMTNYNSYDDYNRLITVANTFGTTSITYNYSIDGYLTTTTTNPAGQVSSKITDASGKIVSATDYGGTLTYTYNSQGKVTQVNQGSILLALNEYDNYARQTKLTDINAGVTQYGYDALGQMITQINALNQSTTFSYDLIGRVTQRVGPEGTTISEYFATGSGASTNKIKKTTGFSGSFNEYTYDTYGRIATQKTTVDAIAHTTTYGYNTYSDLTSTAYPSGFTVNAAYDANGYLNTLKNGDNTVTLFTNTGMNGYNQYKTYTLGNGKSSTNTYYFNIPTRYFTTGVQDLNLSWNYQSGNLNSRNDAVKVKTESFTYDNLNRLLSSYGTGLSSLTMTYASNGNISSKTDAGNFTYGIAKINAVTDVSNPSSNIPTLTQNITYTPYFQPAIVTEGIYSLNYTYGSDYQREKSVLKQNGSIINTKYYFGGYEKDITGSSTKHIHYINAGQGLVAVVVRENGIDTYNYVYTDHLGSILTVTNSTGAIIAEQNFDAWGRKRNTANWTYTGVQAAPSWLYRGFTGHEHLPQFNLINMNGRMYDPVVGRMLSADNNVQMPDFTQNYNRYSYALNNPLRNTDPDGENVVVDAWLVGFVDGFFSSSNNRWDNGLGRANRKATNDLRIWGGLFNTDEHKSFLGRSWELISRFTWQLPQTTTGLGIALSFNMFGVVNQVNSRYGVTVLDTPFDEGAFTVSNYIMGPPGTKPNWRDHLFDHEYGHYIQSQRYGLFYIQTVALPSVTDFFVVDDIMGERLGWINGPLHDTRWYEAEASRLAANYFDRTEGSKTAGYISGDRNYFDRTSFVTGSQSPTVFGSPYRNPRTGNLNGATNPITHVFNWTDIPISSFYWSTTPGLLFSILKL